MRPMFYTFQDTLHSHTGVHKSLVVECSLMWVYCFTVTTTHFCIHELAHRSLPFSFFAVVFFRLRGRTTYFTAFFDTEINIRTCTVHQIEILKQSPISSFLADRCSLGFYFYFEFQKCEGGEKLKWAMRVCHICWTFSAHQVTYGLNHSHIFVH